MDRRYEKSYIAWLLMKYGVQAYARLNNNVFFISLLAIVYPILAFQTSRHKWIQQNELMIQIFLLCTDTCLQEEEWSKGPTHYTKYDINITAPFFYSRLITIIIRFNIISCCYHEIKRYITLCYISGYRNAHVQNCCLRWVIVINRNILIW